MYLLEPCPTVHCQTAHSVEHLYVQIWRKRRRDRETEKARERERGKKSE